MYDIMLQGRKQTKETFISKYLGQTWAEKVCIRHKEIMAVHKLRRESQENETILTPLPWAFSIYSESHFSILCSTQQTWQAHYIL